MKQTLLVFGILALMAAPALATTLLWMDVPDLTRSSTAVVIGRVIGQTLHADKPGATLTRLQVEITETLKGDLEGTVIINNPGFEGSPAFADGDEAVLFIYTRDGTNVLTGFQQGSFKILTDTAGTKVLDRKIPSRERSLTQQRSLTRTNSLDSLVSEIKAVVE